MQLTKEQKKAAELLFGEGYEKAFEENKCIMCKEPALDVCLTNAQIDKWKTTGLCGGCLEKMERMANGGRLDG